MHVRVAEVVAAAIITTAMTLDCIVNSWNFANVVPRGLDCTAADRFDSILYV